MVPVQPAARATAHDEQEAFKRALLTQCVFKLNSDTMNAARWAWFHRPVQTEQPPVAWMYEDGEVLLETDFKWNPHRTRDGAHPLYAAPIAQTAPQPGQSDLVAAVVSAKSAIESLMYRVEEACLPTEHGNEAIKMIDAALSALEDGHDH